MRFLRDAVPLNAIIDDGDKPSYSTDVDNDTTSNSSEAYCWFNNDGLSKCEEDKEKELVERTTAFHMLG